jgi:alanine dehydrogenase
MAVTMPGTHQGIDFKGGLDIGAVDYITLKASSGGYDNNPKIRLCPRA